MLNAITTHFFMLSIAIYECKTSQKVQIEMMRECVRLNKGNNE